MQPASPSGVHRRTAPAVALVGHDRIFVASPHLAEITGYTRGELTSSEFRFGHLFARGTPPLPVPREGEVASDEAVIEPLRGEAITCRRNVLRVGRDPPLYAVILEPGARPMPSDAHQARVEAAQALVRACSSQLATAILRLRRTQLAIETLEHSHPEVLLAELRHARDIIAALEALENDVERLARAAGGVER